MLFKGSQLCILRNYMRENLIKEKHSGGLVIHFGRDRHLFDCCELLIATIVARC